MDRKNKNKFFWILKNSLKGKIGTENSVSFMPRIEEWCSWVKIFIFYKILMILVRANQNSLRIFHQSQISKLSSVEKRLVPTNLLNLSSFSGLVFKSETSKLVTSCKNSTSNNLTCLLKKDKSSCKNMTEVGQPWDDVISMHDQNCRHLMTWLILHTQLKRKVKSE